MPKIFRSSKAIPEKGAGAALSSERQADTTLSTARSLSGENCPDKATSVLTGFMDIIFSEGAHNWSSEEREKRIDACLAEVSAIRRAEDKQDIEDLSRKLRQQIQAGEFDEPISIKPAASCSESQRDDAPRRLSFNFKGYTDILLNFARQVKDQYDDWTPEEFEKRKEACLDRLVVYKKAESDRIFNEVLHDFREIDGASRIGPSQVAPVHPPKKRMTAKQLVDEVAVHIHFG